MKRLTAEEIEALGAEVKAWLAKWQMEEDVRLFYNGKCYTSRRNGTEYGWEISEDDPRDLTEYVAADHILTMFYEGPLYEVLYCGDAPIVSRAKRCTGAREMTEEALHYCRQHLPFQAGMEAYRRGLRYDYGGLLVDPFEYEDHEDRLIALYEEEDALEKEVLEEVIASMKWEITQLAIDEFHEIFNKRGIWFQFGESWNFTCFYLGSQDQPAEK